MTFRVKGTNGRLMQGWQVWALKELVICHVLHDPWSRGTSSPRDLMMLKLPLPWSMTGYLSPGPPSRPSFYPSRMPHFMVSQLLPFSLYCSSSGFAPLDAEEITGAVLSGTKRRKARPHHILSNPLKCSLNQWYHWLKSTLTALHGGSISPPAGWTLPSLSVVTQEPGKKIISLLHHSVNRIWALHLKV